jgi:exosortase K
MLVTALWVLFWLKALYSVWGPEGLVWILKPTTLLVQAFSGLSFYFEPARGYIAHDAPVVIGPGCAGVNYLITACLMGLFYILDRPGLKRKPLAVIAMALMSNALTVMVNALRISGALVMMDISHGLGHALPAWLHRAEGVAVFFLFLLLYFQLLRIVFRIKETADGSV